jgi:hypothetical protein
MKNKKLQFAIALFVLASAIQVAKSAIIPYPNVGTENPVTYTFTATATGDVMGYFAAPSGAAYTEDVGLLDNGVLTSGGYGLNNHGSYAGEDFNFGNVTAGDTLVFVLQVLIPPNGDVYSDPSMNAPFDGTPTGHNHIYSVAYDASSDLLDPSVPSGTYVAFEDEAASLPPDWNYADDTFVFTDTSVTAVPEATTMIAGALLLLPFGLSTLRILRKSRTA